MVSLIVSLLLTLVFFISNFPPAKALALNVQSRLELAASSLVMRMPQLRQGQSEGIYFLGDQRSLQPGIISGLIEAKIVGDSGSLKSTLEIRGANIYQGLEGQKNAGIKLLPEGSVVIGGITNNYFNQGPATYKTPLDIPQGFENLNDVQRSIGIYDFFLSMPKVDEAPQVHSKLYTRILGVKELDAPAEIVLARSGNGSEQRYGSLQPLGRGQIVGEYKIETFGPDQKYETLSSIYATLDEVVDGYPAGSLHIANVGTDRRGEPKLTIHNGGNVGIGMVDPRARLHVNGNIAATGSKNFIIDHPTKKGKSLVHAAIEGPENAVYYRGEGRLVDGQVIVKLPEYFEKLTKIEGRTVSLTNIGGFDNIKIDGGVKNGELKVISDNKNSSQKFNWEVKAVRNDVPQLEVERAK